MITTVLFDWGNTIMVDYRLPGPMFTWERVDWVPGAEKALQVISSQYKCCLATNAGASTTPEVQLALNRVGAGSYFSEIFLAKEIGFEKPDVRFFAAIIERLGQPPSSVVMIGDNYKNDCEGAKLAGLKTLFFNIKGMTDPFPLADAAFRTFDELIPIIGRL
jgi:putative hydrolase of the HAD superfamily